MSFTRSQGWRDSWRLRGRELRAVPTSSAEMRTMAAGHLRAVRVFRG